MPNFCAIAPSTDIQRATVPQQNPFTKPATILLYFGSVFCAQTRVTGCASIVAKPIKENKDNEKTGIDLYVSAKISIIGNVDHIEKYKTGFEPNIFSALGLINEPIEPAKTNKNKAKPI